MGQPFHPFLMVGSEGDTTLVSAAKMRLSFSVTDTGPGISKKEESLLFEAFVQTSAGQSVQEGTGLGLPISQEFARLMGGQISVESVVGKGSTFRFDVLVDVVEETAADTKPLRRVIGIAPGQKTFRILIVEDRPDNRRLLINLLKPMGFDLEEAENGREGVRLWEEWDPDLIWMDMRMPVMDGYEATRVIKATTKGQSTIVVALTASAFEEQRSQVLSAGCDDFVRKPYREEEIFDALTRHLGVKFLYEDSIASSPVKQNSKFRLTQQTLSVLPDELLEQLSAAASQADAEQTLETIDKIDSDLVDITRGLEDLVSEFKFRTILDIARR
jgi:CheY-like chemotaxis protein